MACHGKAMVSHGFVMALPWTVPWHITIAIGLFRGNTMRPYESPHAPWSVSVGFSPQDVDIPRTCGLAPSSPVPGAAGSPRILQIAPIAAHHGRSRKDLVPTTVLAECLPDHGNLLPSSDVEASIF